MNHERGKAIKSVAGGGGKPDFNDWGRDRPKRKVIKSVCVGGGAQTGL